MISDTSSQDRIISHKSSVAWMKWAGLGLVVILAAVILLPKYKQWSAAEISISRDRLSLAVVEQGNLVRDLGVEGKIVASSYPTLYAPARGTITLQVKPGDQVVADQILARIHSPQLQSAVQQDRSRVAALQTEWERQKISARTSALQNEQDVALKKLQLHAAERALDRAKRTSAEGLIGKAELEEAEDDLAIAKLEFRNALDQQGLDKDIMSFEVKNRELAVEREKMVLAESQRELEDLIIRSPVSGVVGSLEVDPSDLVTQNQVLMTVIDLSAFEIEIAIPEVYADEIRRGDRAEITYEGETYKGLVGNVAPEVTGSTVRGTVVFQGTLPEGLKQNQRVSTRIILDEHRDVLKVRRGPFLESSGGISAYVIDGDTATLRTIKTGVTSLTEVQVMTGLAPGETIIISDTTRFNEAKALYIR